jgi:hypothetical protein
VNFTPEEWKAHFGARWAEMVALKRRFDPDFISNPGFLPFEARPAEPEEVTMPLTFGSDAWARRLAAEINASSEYRNAGREVGRWLQRATCCWCSTRTTRSHPPIVVAEAGEGRLRRSRIPRRPHAPRSRLRPARSVHRLADILERKTLAAHGDPHRKDESRGGQDDPLEAHGAHRSLVACAAAIDTEFPRA